MILCAHDHFWSFKLTDYISTLELSCSTSSWGIVCDKTQVLVYFPMLEAILFEKGKNALWVREKIINC